MAAHPLRQGQTVSVRGEGGRLVLLVAVSAAVGAADLSLKAASLAAGSGRTALDTPTTALRPLATLLVAALALTGALRLPRTCLPGALLVLGGAVSNLASLAIWRGVPDPFQLELGGATLHFNLADLCVWNGGLVFLAGAYWTLWRMPDGSFG